ncbi:DUF11 domain-containing protein [Cellulosimicrobium cellulans]|uniref:DUF11 domain-containing protein n=1 Tax=Cellulosimicrobium cellulans TaxID=1710 RepID=UPI001966CA88|nr:DUF11 domain-containing protein [Cellulosimicrobium cellulans]MBN0038557.1 DUF11 domain-containing protein [Cellulosimicrobium cellulans]
MAATEYQITARWADGTPTTEVASGDVINAEWRINVNDDQAAPSNDPVDNVTFTTTVTNGRIASIPDLCLTTGVTPMSEISADGKTLTCNVGTQNEGTAAVVVVPVIVDGPTGETISMTGEINGQTADVPEIPINNPFGMDIRWGTPNEVRTVGTGYVDMPFQWTLSLNKGSDPGPATVSYDLTFTANNGSVTNVAPTGCSAFDGAGAQGHPWSAGSHPADQMAPFVGGCTFVKTGTNTYRLTLTGIDYSRTQVPARDSSNRALPADQDVVASGQITFRVNTTTSTGTTLNVSAPTYTAPSGQSATDDASNNTSTKTITFVGGWSSQFNRTERWMNVGGSSWDDSIRVSPGTTLYQQSAGGIALNETATTLSTCNVLDTKYVEYEGRYSPPGWTDTVGVVTEWYVGSNATVDPNSASYNPANFNCGIADGGWTTTEPTDKSTVKAVRITLPVAQNRDQGITNYGIFLQTRLKDNVPAGQDVWQFGNHARDGVWSPNMATGGPPPGVQDTPDARYPYTSGYRDILRVIVATPAVQKAVDRGVVRPGVPATYTLTYSANGAGVVPPTVDDFRIVDTLPVGMTYVAGSATPAPTVTTNSSGQQVLTWELDGVTTNVQHALTYQAVPDASVDPGQRLQNTVTAEYGGITTGPSRAQVTVSTSGTTDIAKTTDQWFIANPDGDGSGEEGSWTITLRSQDPLPQAFTDTIDILPFNGDGRGTAFSGTYDVTGVNVPAGATVYYTTEDPATLSDDPSDTSNGPAPGTVDPARWSTTPVANPTAIRVIGGELAPGATFAFTVNIEPDGAQPGDTYVNRAQAIAEHTELVMRTSEPLTMGTMYSVSLKKYVQDAEGNWVDANDVAEYPTFRPGETINYRIVVVNTGQGTLRDLVVTDDKQPDLGSFEIDELLPGEENAHVEEYSIVLEEGGPDTVVNTACVAAPQPEDTEDPVDTSCDPAGFEVDGDPTHVKTLLSATPVGNGQWEVVYGIDVTNTSAHPTTYDLDDTLRFTPEASIISATVTTAPAGVTLATPAWDGQGNTAIAANVPLLGNDDAGYAAHHYEVTVIADVPLQVPGAGSDPDPTACPAEGSDAEQGFNNTSQLTDGRGEVEDDQACAPIPSIDITKTVSAGPTPNGDGTWTVTYDIVATNDGAFEGTYEVTDRMTAEGDLEVVSGSVVTAPAGVTPNGSWTGLGAEGAAENVIASGVVLPAGGSHTYQVEVVVGIADGVTGVPVITPCSALGEGENGGLSNAAGVEHNDLTDEATACVTIAFITVDKTISNGPTPNGDGTYTITYDIVAENVGGDAGEYDVFDRLDYGTGIDIVSADVITTPSGVTAEGSWTGLGPDKDSAENLIAENVTLAAGGSHTYQVEVVVEMDEATIDPVNLQCPPPGSGDKGGLANSVSLDHNGIIAEDDVCASLPLIDVDKTISDGPTPNGDGTWTITYDLVATNTGQAAGEYDVRDQLRYGAGINVESADVITTPAGVTAEAGWTGQGGDIKDAENLIAGGVSLEAGGTHTYQVQVVVSLDVDVVAPADLTCPAPGSGDNGGLANTVELDHNGETSEDEACAPLPLIEITKSLSGAVTPVPGMDGVYDVVYEVTATNRGPGAGIYDLDDTLAPGDGVTIVGIQDVVTDAPASVGINPGFNGVGDVRVVTGQPIDGAGTAPVVHTYTVTVRYAADLSDVVIDPAVDTCTSGDGDTVPGGLNNVASIGWNGIQDSDDECVRPGKPTLDKALVSANPVGDGKWEVVYDLTVGNVGTEATTYDLDDELLFAPVITVDSVAVTGPEGVSVNEGFDGDGDQRIATDVAIGGLDDEGYAPHVYRVTVVADVPLYFASDDVGEDGSGSPACTVAAGSNTLEQGLNNAATLTDETGGTQTDTDCAPVPSIDITKVMDGKPAKNADGTWTVNYTITASNDGATAGVYDLTDRLRYGAGITVKTATVTATPEGVTASGTWTGQGEAGAPENVVASDVTLPAGTTHTYQVQVEASLDAGAVNESTFTCPAPGSDGNGGFANTAGIAHNGLTDSAEACDTPDKPGDPGTPGKPGKPGGSLATTGATLAWVAGGAALLLLLGVIVLVAARNRRTTAS